MIYLTVHKGGLYMPKVKKINEMNNNKVTVYLNNEEFKKLNDFCTTNKISKSELLRAFVNELDNPNNMLIAITE